MATDASFVQHVVDQAGLGDRLRYRKMFGEYGFHLDGTFIGMACNNSMYLKATAAIDAEGHHFPTEPPYEGAKPYPVIDELLDDPAALRGLLLATVELLPPPKAKRGS